MASPIGASDDLDGSRVEDTLGATLGADVAPAVGPPYILGADVDTVGGALGDALGAIDNGDGLDGAPPRGFDDG